MTKLHLAETPNSTVTFILLPRNYTLVYHKLMTQLGAKGVFFFARPDVGSEYANWSVETTEDLQRAEVVNYEQLTNEDKDVVADQLELYKLDITTQLWKNGEFNPILDDLFRMPATTCIKILKKEGALYPVLTQWGCKPNKFAADIDPLSMVIQRPRTTTARVVLEFRYTDGMPVTDKTFYLQYQGRESKENIGDDGIYDRGRCKLDSVFSVFDRIGEEKIYLHDFTVTPNGKYLVEFPYPTQETPKQPESPEPPNQPDQPVSNNPQPEDVKPPEPKFVRVRFLDHKNKPLANVPVDFTFNGQTRKETTDPNGFCVMQYEDFVDREKVNLFIHLPKQKRRYRSI